MGNAFTQLMEEHRRLTILRALANPKSGGRINDSILQTIAVDAGIASSRDQIKTAISWLDENGLVEIESLDSGTMVAAITQRGCDVAAGMLTVPGVKRPSPGN